MIMRYEKKNKKINTFSGLNKLYYKFYLVHTVCKMFCFPNYFALTIDYRNVCLTFCLDSAVVAA